MLNNDDIQNQLAQAQQALDQQNPLDLDTDTAQVITLDRRRQRERDQDLQTVRQTRTASVALDEGNQPRVRRRLNMPYSQPA